MAWKDDIRGAFRLGLASARVNFVPVVLLWILAATTVVAYSSFSWARSLFEPLMKWSVAWGWKAAFVNHAFFCGILPGFFWSAFRSIRPRYPLATMLAVALLHGATGIVVNELFRMLSVWFGEGVTLGTLLAKMAFDQFVWTVFVNAPINAVFFFWLARDFSFERVRRDWPRHWLMGVYLPNLLNNWCVWIPVIIAVFSFPLELQIFLCGYASAFWNLVSLQIGKRSGRFPCACRSAEFHGSCPRS